MSSASKGKRNSRKAKTSILYEIKNPVQQSVEVSQSMNIVALKNPYASKQLDKITQQSSTSQNKKIRSSDLYTRNIRRAHQSSKLTITQKDEIAGEIAVEKKHSRSSHSYSPKYPDLNESIDKMIKSRIIMMEKDRIFCDLKTFKNLIGGYISKIELLENQNFQLLSKKQKYEIYIKEMRFKSFPENNDEPCQKNVQLKILNLQRKIETLNYIIKQYRSNNKEEIRNFEKKVNDYKPTLEAELTVLLSKANQKNDELEKMIKHFQNLCQNHCKQIDWVEFVRNSKEQADKIDQLQMNIKNLNEQLKVERKKCENIQQLMDQLNEINSENMELQWKLKQFQDENKKITKQSMQREQKFYDVTQEYEQLTYKYKALQSLQIKICHKDETIRKSNLLISRLQDENFCLKAKLQTQHKLQQKQIFEEDRQVQEKMQQKTLAVEELTKRFYEEADNLPTNFKEISSFLCHLFGKTKDAYEKMINQFRQQLVVKINEVNQWKGTVESLFQKSKKRCSLWQQILQDIQVIDIKRNRCVETQEKFGRTDLCSSCTSWMLHWGQINTLYGQIRNHIEKVGRLV